MAITASVTPGRVFQTTDTITVSALNQLGAPTVDIEGSIGSLAITSDSLDNTHIKSTAGVQFSKLEALTAGNLLVGNSSNVIAQVALSGDATMDSSGAVSLTSAASNLLMPIGSIIHYGAATAPTGWLLCDGSAKNAVVDTTLQALFDVIGNTYGGTNNTDYEVPDLLGRVALGYGAGSGLTSRALNDSGGEEEVKLTGAESGTSAHVHPSIYRDGGSSSIWGNAYSVYNTLDTNTGLSTEADAASAHENLPPYLTVNFLIKK